MGERKTLNEIYFDWLLWKVARNKKEKKELKEAGLLEFIHGIEFTWTIQNDENRAYDGKKLREEFLNDKAFWGFEDSDLEDLEGYLEGKFGGSDSGFGDVLKCFTDAPCSFLEMLIALSYRCEKDIMGDVNSPEDHSKDWFWEFFGNLGGKNWVKKGKNFDKNEVEKRVKIVINREFEPSGEGGLFPVGDKNQSQIRFEIWDILHSYLGKWYPL